MKRDLKEALLYEKLASNLVNCHLCNHLCQIADGKFGFCGVRQNIGGILYTHAYGRLVSSHVDPIEKKPLYHFLPGTKSFSVATIGCNFHCGFCQNWEISQRSFRDGNERGEEFHPEAIVLAAKENQCKSISYTYTEPTIFFEYALDIARIAKRDHLYNIFVTNGYMTQEAILMIRPYLDAANVDLKFFKEDSYRKICAASLGPVMNSIKTMKELGIWVEVTTLIIPGENDSAEELLAIANFLAKIDKNIPWHVSRFHPDYKFTGYLATPEKILQQAQELGHKARLRYVYAGNVYGFGNNTHCHNCNELLVEREGFAVLNNKIRSGKCGACSVEIPGIF